MSARARYHPWFRERSSLEQLMTPIMDDELALHGWAYSIEGHLVLLKRIRPDGFYTCITYPTAWIGRG